MGPELSRVLGSPATSGLAVTMADCPPLQGVYMRGRKRNKACRAFVDSLIAGILRDRPSVVVVAGRWATLASDVRSPGDGEAAGQMVDIATNQPIPLADALSRTLDLLGRNGSRVVLIGPVPEIEFDVPTTLVRSLGASAACPGFCDRISRFARSKSCRHSPI